jgi:hypothetical protein
MTKNTLKQFHKPKDTELAVALDQLDRIDTTRSFRAIPSSVMA